MLMVAVGVEGLAILAQLAGVNQPVVLREGEHLVPGRLDRARLMHVHMAGLRGDHALIRLQHRIDDQLIGLRATGDEADLRLWAIARLANLLLGGLAVVVGAVARQLLHIRLGETFQDRGMSAFTVIVLEHEHGYASNRK